MYYRWKFGKGSQYVYTLQDYLILLYSENLQDYLILPYSENTTHNSEASIAGSLHE